MPTYSLTLRQSVNRKLTIQEMDENFLYLESISGGGTGGAGGGINGTIDSNQVVYGVSSTEIGSSSKFTFDSTNSNLIIGTTNSIDSCSKYSAIIGGFYNSIANNSFTYGPYFVESVSTIQGGLANQICNSSAGSIIGGGITNTISNFSPLSGIIGGQGNGINNSSLGSILTNGYSC